ncbi:DUF3079 domain-containing protein [Pseudoduganella buxea]|uniref:DUF3079 domain-containing protein n=1 Tax=Pseudoduganella buxea TaxID=1949069 RepID=A0A6I3SUR0_9BURK|nr:DUF3079 domain-containing protein [Pseudoduganella buxea]MTV52366.1 DUF3079 domain-containing protein [Pseudoduganella buxea]GGC06456.1 hypothetical protein GCM10011572_30250 [Pseudoduganella buxea]
MAKKFPIVPAHPERICWGCDKYCPIDALACGNGSDRTQHPAELFGEDWLEPILPFPDAQQEDGPGAGTAQDAGKDKQ